MTYPKGGIAFFDSGIGGLTTLKTCVEYANLKFSQSFDYFYYGDNFHAPYGNLSEDKIFEYTDCAFEFFQKLQVRAALIACNTVTAVCAKELRRKYSFPIIGLEPAVAPALKQGGETLVLATRATCSSIKFEKLCEKLQKDYPSSKLTIYACEGLAGFVEKNLGEVSGEYLSFLPTAKPDQVVLGCTHYIYIRKEIEAFYGCPTYDGNVGAARRLFEMIPSSKNEIAKNSGSVDKPQKNSSFFEKSSFLGKSQPLVTTIQNDKNANKSSKIYFVSEAQVVNKNKYEQMFALKKG